MKALLPVVSWISTFAFWGSLLIYIAASQPPGTTRHLGTLPDSGKRDLEIVMVVSLVVFFGIKLATPKQPSTEDPEDNPPSS